MFLVVLVHSLALVGCPAGRYYKVQETGIPVTFTFHGNYRSVCISGDFNNWSRTQCLASKGNGVWAIRIFLKPGQYRYVFLLDGEHQVPDPHGLLEEEDGFGNRNSVLIIS
jgi:1,4-alpha-glucan branching enzyme